MGILRSENSALAEELAEARSEKKDLLISQREAQASLKVLKEKVSEGSRKPRSTCSKFKVFYTFVSVVAWMGHKH